MAKEPRSLAGKVIAITGAARGIGKATASALRREGARVAIGDLDLELARGTADELGGGTIALELDVTRRDSFARFLEQVEAELGPLDVLVNNAGIMPIGPFLAEDDLTAQRMIDINFHGVIYGMKLALPGMVERGSGHVVNIASQAGKSGIPGGATYCGTKHAVVGLSEAVYYEMQEADVDVTCVMPAIVNTELTDGVVMARGVKKVEPEDVANAIVAALKVPKLEVFVPAYSGVIAKFASAVPRRGREAIARLFKVDKVLTEADPVARAAYEDRAAHSEPGLEPERAQPAEPESEPAPTGAPSAAE